MTNGQAANLTAIALTNAIRTTDAYVFANAGDDLFDEDVKYEFETNIENEMGLIGGSKTFTAPFIIPSPAPYLSSFFGAKTDCN